MGAGKGKARRARSVASLAPEKPWNVASPGFAGAYQSWLQAQVAARMRGGRYVPQIGYSKEFDHLQGKKVVIPAGVPLHSTDPKIHDWVLTKRRQTVTVISVSPGAVEGFSDRGEITHDPMILWSGSGNYWREAPADLVYDPNQAPPWDDLGHLQPLAF